MFRGPRKWSPVELDYLKDNRDKISMSQLCIALGRGVGSVKRKLDELDGKPLIKMNKISRIGRREDLNQFFRSGWEANCARWFNHKGKSWKYEPDVFFFEGIKHGTVSYCPDFKVGTLYVEVKGQLDQKGRTAIRRFKKFYPKEFKKLRAIVGKEGTKAEQFFKKEGVPVMAYINDLNKKYKDKLASWE